MQFHSRANRKLIALTMMAVFTVDTYAAIYLKPGVLLPLSGDAQIASDFIPLPERAEVNKPLSYESPDPKTVKDQVTKSPFSEPEAALVDKPKPKKEDIDGPGQPESKGFRPAGLDNMVDLFTGDFSYNIPLLDVGGYPVNLFYNGGISMDQEASWVGLGFNINPGSVTRNMRGLPDDFDGSKGDNITKVINIKKDITVGVNIAKAVELFGMPKNKKFTPASSLSIGVSYNNYRGTGIELGVNPSLSISDITKTEKTKSLKDTSVVVGNVSGGLNIKLNSQSGLNLSPYISYKKIEEESLIGATASVGYNSRAGLQSIQMSYSETRNNQDPTQGTFLRAWVPELASTISFARPSVMPTISVPMNTFNANLSLRFGKGYKKGLLKGSPTLAGYLSISQPRDQVVVRKAFGYFNYTAATGKEDLLDFNRINDIPYQNANPVVSFPVYTYDIFSISGEGTGGSFRGYRSDIGYVRDPQQKSNNTSFALGVGLNKGDEPSSTSLKIDIDMEPVITPVETGPWQKNNFAKSFLEFTRDKGTYQSVYFKNPAEKTIIDKTFFDATGGEDLVRIKMAKLAFDAQLQPQLERFTPESKYRKGVTSLGLNTVRQVRDKRSQVITALTAKEASVGGLNSKIEYYPLNVYPRGDCDQNKRSFDRWEQQLLPSVQKRKAHHLSEITVLGGDGRRYVYGIPVYNYRQKDVTFNVQGNTVTGDELVNYSEQDASADNSKGRDHYYQSEETPAYAHSFLLTGLISPDYVDLKGDGITEDDLGNAVKFNYTKMFYGDRDFIRWRMPSTSSVNFANYSKGLSTDNTDDKAHYSYGEREQWYLNSVESKTMIATFKLEPRSDGKESVGENGGVNQDAGAGAYLLREINLYSKAAYKISGNNARPIKTVHFEYDYSLCPGTPNNSSGGGKLTLKRVWFSYAGNNQRQFKNAYVFKYRNNRAFTRTASDRWGNYKDASLNPGAVNDKLPNSQFPYVNQSIGEPEVAPWQLEEVVLPSGGKIKVTYESDDYGYVQNKRAAAMLKIAGFGENESGSFDNKLYVNQLLVSPDKRFVYFQATEPLNADAALAKKQVAEKYLADIKQLYLKLYVKVPSDQLGSGYEPISVYTDIVDYGAAPNRNYFWIKTGAVNNHVSQIMDALVQFGKDNLTSKIYPGYNTRNEGAVKSMVKALIGMSTEILRTVGGFDYMFRAEKKFKEVNLDNCFARLSHPGIAKKGGGYRVKEVRIQDQWDIMTQQYKSEFGQVYDYTTTMRIGGEDKTVSSGVASYEPAIGGEENPFREIMRSRVSKPLAKDQYLLQEMPVGEMFFPSAMVGYSKVRVSSIKKTNVKNGVTQQESTFYTTKDFPTMSSYTTFDQGGKIRFRPDPFSRILTHYSRRADCLSQGLLVNLNDMNGKLHTQVVYADNDLKNPVNYTENLYRMDKLSDTQMKLNNLVPVVKGPDGKVYENELIGKDIEMMVDFRQHVSKTYTAGINANLEILKIGLPPIIIPVIMGTVYYDESIYRSASMVKVINTYGILDSVVNIDKGSQVSTKNMIYDAETGEVLVNRTNNEFDKSVYNFSYPAYWAYKGMGPAYKNISAVFTGIDIRDGLVAGGSMDMNMLQSGDELIVLSSSILSVPSKSQDCQIVEGNGGAVPALSTANIIWAIDANKDPLNTTSRLLFIDRNGNLITGKNMTLKILRSGYRNFLGASVGSTVSQKSPVQLQSGQPYVVLNNLAGVLNAGVQEFKENWRVDTLLEGKDSIVWAVNSGSTTYHTLTPVNTYSLSVETKRQNINLFYSPTWSIPTEQAFYTKAQSKKINGFLGIGDGVRYYRTKSWQQYDLSVLPAGSFVKSAYLTLGIYRQNSAIWSHVSRTPMTNLFYLSRTRHPWYPSGDTRWRDQFNTQTADNLAGNGQPVYALPGNGSGYSNNPASGINVTAITRSIKRDLSLGYGTGFRISLNDAIPDKQDENKIRFKHHSEPTTNCSPDFSCTKLEISCLTCPPGYKVDSIKQPKGYYSYICTGNDTISTCVSVFNRLRVNPYTTGMLGNWRPYRSKVYYSNRVESAVSQEAYSNKAGVIYDFKPYWLFNAAGLTASTASEWVWNSEITQFNQKGAELENKDPLGRYNAGLYGYNELLPIAVANNARYQELAYDGFEDYGFSTQDCQVLCKKGRRLNYNNGGGITVDNSVSHTGTSSMRINANSTVMLDGVVKPSAQTDNYAVNIGMSSSSATLTWVNGKGTGFQGKYYASNNFTGTPLTQIDPQVNFNWPQRSSSAQATAKSIKWEGYLQADENAAYSFQIRFQGNLTIRFNNTVVVNVTNYSGSGLWDKTFSQTLVKGTVYRVEIEYRPIVNRAHSISLKWMRMIMTWNGIPASLVYPPGTENLAPSAITSQTWWCHKNTGIGGRGNYLLDGFNLIQGRKMWVSAWVKEGSQDCKCATYTAPAFQVYLNGSPAFASVLKATGSIIDGWQRFEGEFLVPETATTYSLRFMNTASNTVWMDDVRVQPFNAQMKTFVYHPVNLRLMAEMDENNYATFYEYDDDGTLVRVKKETEKGIKTISESRTSLQKKIEN